MWNILKILSIFYHLIPTLNTTDQYNETSRIHIYVYTFSPLKIFSYLFTLFNIRASCCIYHHPSASLARCIFTPSTLHFSTFRHTFRTVPLLLFRLLISFPSPSPSALWSDGSIVRCPGYNPIRLELDRDNRDGPRVVANGVATIPRTALDRSFIFTDSPRNAIPTPPPLDSLKPATTGLSLGQCGENSLDFSYVRASARGPSIPMQGIIQTFVEINLSSKTVDLALSKKKPFNVLASFSFGIGNVSSRFHSSL